MDDDEVSRCQKLQGLQWQFRNHGWLLIFAGLVAACEEIGSGRQCTASGCGGHARRRQRLCGGTLMKLWVDGGRGVSARLQWSDLISTGLEGRREEGHESIF